MNRKQKRLARRVKRQAYREANLGRMSNNELKAVMLVCESPKKLNLLQHKIDQARLNPWDGPDNLLGADWKTWWSNIWDWFAANWPSILKFILSIAPLLLLEPKHEDR